MAPIVHDPGDVLGVENHGVDPRGQEALERNERFLARYRPTGVIQPPALDDRRLRRPREGGDARRNAVRYVDNRVLRHGIVPERVVFLYGALQLVAPEKVRVTERGVGDLFQAHVAWCLEEEGPAAVDEAGGKVPVNGCMVASFHRAHDGEGAFRKNRTVKAEKGAPRAVGQKSDTARVQYDAPLHQQRAQEQGENLAISFVHRIMAISV
jgi:hypothetical protein